MTYPDVLVVTPTLGSRPSVSKTIESVYSIGGSRVFHCIVGPISKIAWIKDRYPYVHLLDDTRCDGIYSALNLAIFKYSSQFKYFAFINDDDYWLPGFIRLFHLLDSSPTLTLVYGRTQVVDLLGHVIKTIAHFPFPSCFLALLKFHAPMFTQQSVLCRSYDLTRLSAFDTSLRLYADSDLWARWIQSGRKIESCSAICSSYCYEGDRLSNNTLQASADLCRLGQIHAMTILPQDVFIFLAFRLYNSFEYLQRLLRRFIKTIPNAGSRVF
jgi:glycosyltransferase involved in cell wall biosynthesis